MPDPADRRAAERFPVSADTSCSFAAQVVEDLGPVKVKNLSMDGIGLISTRRVDAGKMVVITLANASKSFSKTMVVKVAHVTAQPGGFLVGGTFSSQLTYQELTTLVL
jgi:hypothetical protein